MASGKHVDIDLLARVSSHIRRISESIGLDRKVKVLEPTLDEILAAHNAPSAKPSRKPARAPETLDEILAAGDGEEPSSAAPGSIGEAAE